MDDDLRADADYEIFRVVNPSLPTLEPPPIPAPPELAARAEALVRKYNAQCFWFWHPEAFVKNMDDVKLVIRRLREYGNHAAWKEAQQLHKCL